jgi:hypothetical protein
MTASVFYERTYIIKMKINISSVGVADINKAYCAVAMNGPMSTEFYTSR